MYCYTYSFLPNQNALTFIELILKVNKFLHKLQVHFYQIFTNQALRKEIRILKKVKVWLKCEFLQKSFVMSQEFISAVAVYSIKEISGPQNQQVQKVMSHRSAGA